MTPESTMSHERLLELLDALCDDRLSVAESAELGAALNHSPELHGVYLDYMGMEFTIRRLHAAMPSAITGDEARQMQALAAGNQKLEPGTPAVPAAFRPPFAKYTAAELFYWRIGEVLRIAGQPRVWRLAALFVLVASVALTWVIVAGRHGLAPQPAAAQTTAALADAVGARWAAPHGDLCRGAALPPGTLTLERGTARIALANGTDLVVCGPTTFTVNSSTQMRLEQGHLTATVPHSAAGFAVQTPTVKVVDLGTIFGVDAGADGSAEVHVLRGKVQASVLASDGGQKSSTLVTENHALALGHGETAFTEIPAAPARFVTDIRQGRMPFVMCGTGESDTPGAGDRHWRISAVDNDPKTRPGPAYVLQKLDRGYMPNRGRFSRWISVAKEPVNVAGNGQYTFTTEFDFDPSAFDPATTDLYLRLAADNEIAAVRLNGHDMGIHSGAFKDRLLFCATHWSEFHLKAGVVPGTNRLEVVVGNLPVAPEQVLARQQGRTGAALPEDFDSHMAFRAELIGTAVRRAQPDVAPRKTGR